MVQTIILSGGYGPGVVVVDMPGADLTGATLKLALVLEDDPYPAANASSWVPVTPETDRSLHLPVGSSTPPAHYHVWVQISVGGAVVPVRVLDADGRPFLVHVV